MMSPARWWQLVRPWLGGGATAALLWALLSGWWRRHLQRDRLLLAMQTTTTAANSESVARSEASTQQILGPLEHALSVLDAMLLAAPPRGRTRRLLVDVCARLEAALGESMAVQLMECEPRPDLLLLHKRLSYVKSLRASSQTVEQAVGAVQAALDELDKCCDTAKTEVCRALDSAEAGVRARALAVLRGLERAVLNEAVLSEVSIVSMLLELGADTNRSDEERSAAWMSVFTVCFRNCSSLVVRRYFADAKRIADCLVPLVGAAYDGRLNGREGTRVLLCCAAFFDSMTLELAYKSDDVAVREPMEKAILNSWELTSQQNRTEEQMRELTPFLVDAMVSDDIVCMVGAAAVIVRAGQGASGPVAIAALIAGDAPRALWKLRQRFGPPGQPASFWNECAKAVNLDSLCLNLVGGAESQFVNTFNAIPHDTLWDAQVAEAVWLIKMNHAAKLSQQSWRIPFTVIFAAMLLAKAALDRSRHESLLKTTVAESLLYAIATDVKFVGLSLGAGAASAAVSLIGRNEGGLALSREAADAVLRDFKTFFVPNTRRGTYPPNRLMPMANAIVNMVISDANKAFVVEHDGAIDALVAGLLMDEDNPRRTQEAGDELQATCALALQNLALSDMGKAALRSHVGVMEGLRRVSSSESGSVGMTAEARQYASGALFELDESSRRQQRAAASSQVGEDGGMASVVVEHVMQSSDSALRTNLLAPSTGSKH
eukprot:COSAG05_NODE_737_length_7636_cov_48.020433_2_plen_718_part_00